MAAAQHFSTEAKRLLDSEDGRRSLPAVQGLLIMYAYSTGIGKDRGGMMFRYAAYDMLNRLDLEEGFLEGTNMEHNNKERKA